MDNSEMCNTKMTSIKRMMEIIKCNLHSNVKDMKLNTIVVIPHIHCMTSWGRLYHEDWVRVHHTGGRTQNLRGERQVV